MQQLQLWTTERTGPVSHIVTFSVTYVHWGVKGGIVWARTTIAMCGAVLISGAMSLVSERGAAGAAEIGGCPMRVDLFTLDALDPEPDDLRYRVAFFLTQTPPDVLNAAVAGHPPGTAVPVTPRFTPPEGTWLFRRPLPWPSDPDALELQEPQDYRLYALAADRAYASLGLAGLPAPDGQITLPAFFGHVSDTLFFAIEPAGDITACTLNPNAVFNEIDVLLTREIAQHAH